MAPQHITTIFNLNNERYWSNEDISEEPLRRKEHERIELSKARKKNTDKFDDIHTELNFDKISLNWEPNE